MAPRRSSRLQTKSVNDDIKPTSVTIAKTPRSTSSNKKSRGKGTRSQSRGKRGKGRGNASRNSSSNGRTPRVTNFLEVIDIIDIPQSLVPPRRNSRPQVVNLDVTYSESSGESDVEEVSTPSQIDINSQSKKDLKNGHHSVSDSDEDFVADFCPQENEETKCEKNVNRSFAYDSDSDSDIDIYKVSYKDEREKAFEEVEKEMKKMKERSEKKKKEEEQNLLSILNDSALDTPNFLDNDGNSDADSPLPSFVVNSAFSDHLPPTSKRTRSIIRTSKKTKAALASLQAFSKNLENDFEKTNLSTDSFYDNDIIMMEGGTNISIRICWGSTYTRHTLKKNNKFISLYQELAEKHNVSVNEVLLSFSDIIITPETTPSDLSLSVGDILDGAIIPKSSNRDGEKETSKNEGMLSFKMQTSNRREVHTVSINKYDKMSILMEKYATLRNIPLNKLRFNFDGESLESSDTPFSLDLEGGECIDVFEL